MDPISQNNPTNNPRLDLLHSTGDNQQLNGAVGSYGPAGPAAVPPTPQPPAPSGGAPQSASSYVNAAQARRPQAAPAAPPVPPAPVPAPAPAPMPRPASSVPLYTGAMATADESGGVGVAGIVIGVVILLAVMGGMYLMFSSQISNQNKQIQAALGQLKGSGGNNTGALGDISSSSINNSGDLKTQTLEVQGTGDTNQTSLTVNGSSEFQGPVKFDQDVTVGGNETVTGSVTAGSFIGDGSQLTGLPSGTQGPVGPAGATGPAGAPNPNAVFATNAGHATTADTATDCTTCVHLQGSGQDTGSISVTGSGTFGGNLTTTTAFGAMTLNVTPTTGGSLSPSTTYYFKLVALNGSTVIASSAVTACALNSAQTQCNLSWTGLTEATGYKIYRSMNNGSSYNGSVSTSSTAYNYGTTVGDNTSDTTPGTPSGAFTVGQFGGASDNFTYNNFGIGTNSPSVALDVVGAGNFSGNLAVGGGLTVTGAISGASLSTGSGAISGGSITQNGHSVCDASNNCSDVSLQPSISTTQTGSLSINGTAQAGAVNVLAGGSVNAPSYSLNGSTLVDTSGNGTLASLSIVGTKTALISSSSGASFSMTLFADKLQSGNGATLDCTGGGHVSVNQVTDGIVTSVGNSGTCVAGADYAEYYHSAQTLSPGTVVAIDTEHPQYVVASTTANQATAIGVVSTQPGETVGTGGNTVVAEAGHVPVNVTGENGPIAPGDYLTPSSTPGYAMKAGSGDKTIAQAMDSFTGASGQVDAFIEISNGGVSTVAATNTQSNQTQPAQSTNQFSDLNVSGTATVADLTVTGTAAVADLKVSGTATIANLEITGHVTGNDDTRGELTIPAGATSATHAFTTAYGSKPTVVASPEAASGSFYVTATTDGFTVTVDTAPTAPLTFSYLVEQ